jgi:tRNA A37 N6-isopentenylltransferase MiaA
VKNIIIIYGPTGSGKTHLCYNIINHLKKNICTNYDVENFIQNIYKNYKLYYNGPIIQWKISSSIGVINMDSKQLYYHLPHLTASPSIQEKTNGFHFLFNDKLPYEGLSVNDWYSQIMDFIDNTGFDYYIIIGGSSFYLKYLLTQHIYYNNYNFDDLTEIFFKYFPWEFNQKYFKIDRLDPHINDDFRKYNFIKAYFSQKYSSHLLDHRPHEKNNFYIKNNPYEYYCVIINPSGEVLKNNIMARAKNLNIDDLKKSISSISIHHIHKQFSSIIGYELLTKNWDFNIFIQQTFQYGKNQKKWINYFLKNNFFNYNYFYWEINEI